MEQLHGRMAHARGIGVGEVAAFLGHGNLVGVEAVGNGDGRGAHCCRRVEGEAD